MIASLFLNVNKLLLYENDGRGHFSDVTFTKKALPVFGLPLFDLASADIDGDGDLDFIAGGWISSTFLFVNDGKGRFKDESAKRLLPLPAKGTGFVEFGDVDGDGDADLVVGDFGTGARLYINDGKGVFREAPATRFPRDAIVVEDIKIFDADLDGDQDVLVFGVVPRNKGGIHAIYENNGKGFFSNASDRLFPRLTAGGPLKVAIGDIDRDGDTDVVLGNATGVWQNTTWFNTSRQLYPTQDAVIGKPYPIELHGPPLSQALLMFAGARGRLQVPPFGILGLDLRSTTLLPSPIGIGKSRRVVFPGAIPNLAALRGLSLHSQALLLDVRQLSRSRFTNPFADVIR